MKCNKKPFNNRYARATISNVMEILIPLAMWRHIEKVQQSNPTLTYSWITRYVLSRLLSHARLKKFRQNTKLQQLLQKDKSISKARKDCHRHSMCLYGADEEKIKELALKLHINVSTLVRIALFSYLHELEQEEKIPFFLVGRNGKRKFGKISLEKILYFGTKVVKSMDIMDISEKQEKLIEMKWLYREYLFKEDDFWWGMLTGQYIQTIEVSKH